MLSSLKEFRFPDGASLVREVRAIADRNGVLPLRCLYHENEHQGTVFCKEICSASFCYLLHSLILFVGTVDY